MDRARYILAVILLLSWPPGLLLWFAIHPFARFWRKVGPGWTYGILAAPSLLLATVVWRFRHRLLSVDLGTSYPLIGLAVVTAVGAGILAVKRRKYLTFRILAGVPELARGDDRGVLLRDGIYGVIRHPRYIEALLGVATYALFSNYLGLYVLLLLSLPALYLVVLLEERELRDRFGADYESYCRKVPRFLPRSWRSVVPGGRGAASG
ncbi:MAG: methyltransferase family protein [Thermoanaerobaculia bacterium]